MKKPTNLDNVIWTTSNLIKEVDSAELALRVKMDQIKIAKDKLRDASIRYREKVTDINKSIKAKEDSLKKAKLKKSQADSKPIKTTQLTDNKNTTEDFEFQAEKPLRQNKVNNMEEIPYLELKLEIKKLVINTLHELNMPAKSYKDYTHKYYDSTVRNWALFASLYEKDIVKAKTQKELDQRERSVLPNLPRKDMRDAYSMFLLYRHDIINGIENECNIKEIIESAKTNYKRVIKEIKTKIKINGNVTKKRR